jgi:hypothetical protein
VICSKCQSENRKSIVYVGVSESTTMYAPPFYDEQDVYHNHDPNRVTTHYSCSNGHEFQETTRRKCPGCAWPNEEKSE